MFSVLVLPLYYMNVVVFDMCEALKFIFGFVTYKYHLTDVKLGQIFANNPVCTIAALS